MALINTARAHTRTHSAFGPFALLIDSVTAWNERRQTRNALSQLSDRELDDIGLSRSDIDRVADRA